MKKYEEKIEFKSLSDVELTNITGWSKDGFWTSVGEFFGKGWNNEK